VACEVMPCAERGGISCYHRPSCGVPASPGSQEASKLRVGNFASSSLSAMLHGATCAASLGHPEGQVACIELPAVTSATLPRCGAVSVRSPPQHPCQGRPLGLDRALDPPPTTRKDKQRDPGSDARSAARPVKGVDGPRGPRSRVSIFPRIRPMRTPRRSSTRSRACHCRVGLSRALAAAVPICRGPASSGTGRTDLDGRVA
jgi:hypothetical protein